MCTNSTEDQKVIDHCHHEHVGWLTETHLQHLQHFFKKRHESHYQSNVNQTPRN